MLQLTIKFFLLMLCWLQLSCTQMHAQDANVQLNAKPSTPTAKEIKADKKNSNKKEEAENIYLNFDNASLTSVLHYLAEEKKLNILPHKELENVKVSLTTRKPLTLERAWNVLLTLLEMNGFSIIDVNGLHRIVPNKDNGMEPLPTYSSAQGMEPEKLPDSDLTIRYVYFFKNLKVDIAQGILSTMLEGDRSIIVNADLQVIIMKEKCLNIKAAMKILKELDLGGIRESIQIIRLKEADADTVAQLFTEILGSAEREQNLRFAAPEKTENLYFSSSTKIISYPEKNSLILLGTQKNLDRLISFIYKYIDVPIGSAQSRLHIKELRYAQAEKMKPILEKIIQPPQGQKSEKSLLVGHYKFFEDVFISAETPTEDNQRASGNRLIIACNQEDWKRLNDFIDKLDKPQPQVALEVLIIDITETQIKELGTQLQTIKRPGLGINHMEFQNLTFPAQEDVTNLTKGLQSPRNFANTLFPDDLGVNSPAFLTLGKVSTPLDAEGNPLKDANGNPIGNNMWAVIRSVINVSNSQVIAQPYTVVNNFQECTVKVSNTIRVKGPLRSDKGENKVSTSDDKEAGVQLVVTPQINSDGIIDLKIDVTIDEFGANTSADGGPSVVTRHIITKSSMAAGQVLVLGGLKKSKQTLSNFKTPVLGDIPIIGNLFKAKDKRKDEDNLYVFIRPSIIKPSFEGEVGQYTQLKLDYAKYQLLKNDDYAQDKDPIQRWFFRPSKSTARKTIADARKGIMRPVDDFIYRKGQPPTVKIKEDPYFKVSEALQEAREKRNALKKMKQRKLMKQRDKKIRALKR